MCRLYGSRQSQPYQVSQSPAPKIHAAPSMTWNAPNRIGQRSRTAMVSHNAASQRHARHDIDHDSVAGNCSPRRIAPAQNVAAKLANWSGMRKQWCSQSIDVKRKITLASKQIVAWVSKLHKTCWGNPLAGSKCRKVK